jgi:hypothetical protein
METTQLRRSALPRPGDAEYDEYYRRYVALVPDGDILFTLRDQLADTIALLQALPVDRESYRYQDGKWSVREILGHCIDVERLFESRALAMARQDGVDLPGMDQDAWASRNDAHKRTLADLLEEWKAVRRACVHLFATFDEATGARTGRASERPFTVRAFAWIIAGHELWHREVIRSRYLGGE